MTKTRWGALCWVLCAVTIVPQILAALQWPQAYSWSANLISDLGVTACGTYNVGTDVERAICSPWHLAANASTVANGLLTGAGAVLLFSVWPKLRQGQWAMALLVIGGVLVALVGLLPWDLYPAAHEVVALVQPFFQWAGMILLLLAVRGSARFSGIAVVSLAGVAVSVAGFALFLSGVAGGPTLGLGLGAAERLAFDTLTLWSLAAGLLLLRLPAAGTTSTADAPGQLTSRRR